VPALQGAVPGPDDQHGPVAVREHLGFDVPCPLEVALDEALLAAERGGGLAPRRVQRLRDLGDGAGDLEAASHRSPADGLPTAEHIDTATVPGWTVRRSAIATGPRSTPASPRPQRAAHLRAHTARPPRRRSDHQLRPGPRHPIPPPQGSFWVLSRSLSPCWCASGARCPRCAPAPTLQDTIIPSFV
jgi:hypothetical protein